MYVCIDDVKLGMWGPNKTIMLHSDDGKSKSSMC
jgi:hypothetical protein